MSTGIPANLCLFPRLHCPDQGCRRLRPDPESRRILRFGFFRRHSDSRSIQRYRCLGCKRTFSSATLGACYRQKKRQLNEPIRKLLANHGNQRGIARVLGINPKTVAAKTVFLGKQAELQHRQFLLNRYVTQGAFESLQFDEQQTSLHTKLKPLSIPLIVEARTRLILGFDVCQMPASGNLAAISEKKYGKRADQRVQTLNALFCGLKPFISKTARFRSDSHPYYPPVVSRHYPQAEHLQVLGRDAHIAGQGELKKGGFDPIFSLNHTCAMNRAHVSRLIRKTWCTTKRIDRLIAHLWIYVVSHNRRILSEGARI